MSVVFAPGSSKDYNSHKIGILYQVMEPFLRVGNVQRLVVCHFDELKSVCVCVWLLWDRWLVPFCCQRVLLLPFCWRCQPEAEDLSRKRRSRWWEDIDSLSGQYGILYIVKYVARICLILHVCPWRCDARLAIRVLIWVPWCQPLHWPPKLFRPIAFS